MSPCLGLTLNSHWSWLGLRLGELTCLQVSQCCWLLMNWCVHVNVSLSSLFSNHITPSWPHSFLPFLYFPINESSKSPKVTTWKRQKQQRERKRSTHMWWEQKGWMIVVWLQISNSTVLWSKTILYSLRYPAVVLDMQFNCGTWQLVLCLSEKLCYSSHGFFCQRVSEHTSLSAPRREKKSNFT